MLLGRDDDMTPAEGCRDVTKKVAAPAVVRIVVYAGAFHAVDVAELPAKTQYGFATIGYHRPQRARRSSNSFVRSTRRKQV